LDRTETAKFPANSQETVVSPATTVLTGQRSMAIAGMLTMAMGAMHIGITFLAYKPLFRLPALWFAGTGVAIVLIGAVTYMARVYSAGAPERWIAVAANLAGLVIAVAYEALNEWSEWRGYLQIGFFATGLVASLRGGHPVAVRDPAAPPL
jgi:hypothetical protein